MSTVVLRNTKGSALTFTELDNNFSNLNSDKLEAVSTDTSPQLGGNLDVNGNSIVSASAGNIAITPDTTGSIVLDGQNWPQADGTTGQYLKTNGAGQLSWADVDTDTNTTYTVSAVDSGANAIIRLTGSDASTDDVTLVAGTNITLTPSGDNITIAATGTGILDIVEDTTPQLGGNLDVNGNDIVSTSNGNIRFSPDGSGNINLNVTTGNIILDYANWPATDGTNGYVLTTNGAGALSWTAVSGGGGISNVVEDTTPQLGGNLDVNGNSIVSVSGGNILITPDTTGSVIIDGLYYPQGDGSAGQVLYTDGTTQLGFKTVLENVVEDTTPQLGGDLDAQGNTISNPVLEDYAETVYALGSTDTPTITIGNGNVQTVTITSGLALPAFSDAATGQSVTLIVTGSGTASGTGAYKFAGGNTTLTSYSVVSVFYDGTTYWASIATDFQ